MAEDATPNKRVRANPIKTCMELLISKLYTLKNVMFHRKKINGTIPFTYIFKKRLLGVLCPFSLEGRRNLQNDIF